MNGVLNSIIFFATFCGVIVEKDFYTLYFYILKRIVEMVCIEYLIIVIMMMRIFDTFNTVKSKHFVTVSPFDTTILQLLSGHHLRS